MRARGPTSTSLFLALAVALLSDGPARAHGELHGQIEDLSTKIAAFPANARLHLMRGELYRLHGDPVRAESDYDRAAALDPKLSEVDLARARFCVDAQRWPCALAALDRFLATSADHGEALVLRARSRAAAGRTEEAVRDLDRAVAVSVQPEPDLYVTRAEVQALAGGGGLDRALAGLEDGRKRLGPIVSLDEKAIELLLAAGRHEQALARLDRMFARSPRRDLWLARRAEILERAGRHRQARAARAQALAALAKMPPELRQRPATAALEASLRAARK